MSEMRNSYSTEFGKVEWRKPLGRCVRRFKVNVKMDMK
jgi:hypothetical protein